ncbi:hypothetical protein ACJ73_01373 [Blastomyces percursus]|uniref:STEEP1 domain-containing protein n=1 Tax=Blastomyces percursus TaxID=1658174 RepID=A0A1J9R4E4_9EURO|nr:hypothetical protein ACJ73_01373 [Blastomyces percursus]
MATISDGRSPAAAKSPSPSSKARPASLSQPQSRSQSPNPNPDADANTDTNITDELQQIPQTRLPIKTYHCTFCNHLLLASTRDLHLLPRRREPARDRALILPLPKAGAGEEEEEEEDEEEESEDELGAEGAGEAVSGTGRRGTDEPTTESRVKKKIKLDLAQQGQQQEQQQQQQQHYTILLSTTIRDRKPTMIRREDGFEKRLLMRCGRCRVVMGYALDEIHFTAAVAREGGGGDEKKGKEIEDEEGDGEDNKERERERRRKKAEEVVYLLPGSLVETGEMGKVEKEEWAGWEKGGNKVE